MANAIESRTATSRSAFCSTVGCGASAGAALSAAAVAAGGTGDDCGLKTSTVTAPTTTRSRPARNNALSWLKLRFIAAVRSVLITGAPPKTSGMT